MGSFDFLIFLSPIILSQIIFISAQQRPSSGYHFCSGANYTTNSTYQSSLNLLLSSLSSNALAINGGFYNTTVGQDSDTIHALFLCRGDTTQQQCQSCVKATSEQLIKLCPNKKIAITWLDLCMLRYSNNSMFSKLEQSPRIELVSSEEIGSDPVDFNRTLGELMDDLISEAVSGDETPHFFATGEERVSDFERVYGMVQCSPDISRSDCNACLRESVGGIPSCCSGKKGATILRPSCFSKFESTPFSDLFRNTSKPDADDPPSSSTTDSNTEEPNGSENGPSASSINTVAIVIPAVIGAIFIFAILGYLWMIKKPTNKKKIPQMNTSTDHEIGNVESLQFDSDTIRVAANNFSNANKLGKGGFGAVYKGTLLDGQEIAVKKLSLQSGQGSQEFKNEVVLLHKLQHHNLVRLLGFCLKEAETLLIYEFVPSRSLDKYLFDPTRKANLDWETRYKIIGGIAQGLLYLHEDSHLRIVHGDLKAGNILLDGEMNPKISDFGMAKLFVVEQTQGNTSRVAGTSGYMAPEYAVHGLFSVKSDVFSFGVLLLEIISGQKITNFNQSGPSNDLLSSAWEHWSDGTTLELVDPILTDNYTSNKVIRCIHIGLLCVQENVNDRPTMSTVVLMLNSFSDTLPSPSPPPFSTESRTDGWESDTRSPEPLFASKDSSIV